MTPLTFVHMYVYVYICVCINYEDIDIEIWDKGKRREGRQGSDFNFVFWSLLIMSQYPLTAINLINLSTLDSQGFLLMDFAVLQIINWFFCDI